MLAAADALLEGEHIAVDLLTERLSARRPAVDAAGRAVAVALSGFAARGRGLDMVGFSRMVGLMSNGYMAVPMWIPQLLIPIGRGADAGRGRDRVRRRLAKRKSVPAVTALSRTTGIE